MLSVDIYGYFRLDHVLSHFQKPQIACVLKYCTFEADARAYWKAVISLKVSFLNDDH